MCLRESPPMFGPEPIGKNTFVAITSSSRLPYSRKKCPVTTSLCPCEYTSAVSKKLMPASIARLKNGPAASCSSTHGRQLAEPKLMHPRHNRETLTPVFPSRVYSIVLS
jgi:hypothetical protein